MNTRLKRGDLVRIRASDSHEWIRCFVALASDTDPSSVMLMFDGAVRNNRGGVYLNALPLTVNYQAETVTALNGDEFQLEVQSDSP